MRVYFGVKHVFLVSSGKAALTIILRALQSLHPGKNRVIIPAYTCFSVPSAIVKAGLEPSLCDIDLSTLDFDHKLLEASLTRETLCIIPTHLFGIPSDVDGIRGLCRGKGIVVVEDAAQAMGVRHRGKRLGTLGDVGFFSLGRGKNITCGSGGIIVTNSDTIAGSLGKEYARLEFPRIRETMQEFLKATAMSIFLNPALFWFPSGLPFLNLGETVFYKDFPVKRLSGMQAGLLQSWMRNLEDSNRARLKNTIYFSERLDPPGNRHRFVPCLRLPFLAESKAERELVCGLSKRRGLGISRMYPMPVNEIEELKERFKGKNYLSAKTVAETLLAVPTHHLLSTDDKENIGAALDNALGGSRRLPERVRGLRSGTCTE